MHSLEEKGQCQGQCALMSFLIILALYKEEPVSTIEHSSSQAMQRYEGLLFFDPLRKQEGLWWL